MLAINFQYIEFENFILQKTRPNVEPYNAQQASEECYIASDNKLYLQ